MVIDKNEKYRPCIIVVAYNRPRSLTRLLTAIKRSHFSEINITLIISIDGLQPDPAVLAIATSFAWQHGPKEIISQHRHLGLKAHVLRCGDLSRVHGAAIILEDDLLVSPNFYNYGQQALNCYGETPAVAGISLYSYRIAENGFLPFEPVADGTPGYFMQVASSWGWAITAAQWARFRDWFATHPTLPMDTCTLPAYLKSWSAQSWKKHFIHYLIAEDRYFYFPRTAYCTNFEDPGTHASTRGLYQVPLQLGDQDVLPFTGFEDTPAKYDAWFEPTTACVAGFTKVLEGYDYTVDLYGQRSADELSTPYVLTSRPTAAVELTFGNALFPLLNNILLAQVGDALRLAPVAAISARPLPRDNFFTTWQALLAARLERPEERQRAIGFELLAPLSVAGNETFWPRTAVRDQSWNPAKIRCSNPTDLPEHHLPFAATVFWGALAAQLDQAVFSYVGLVTQAVRFVPETLAHVACIFTRFPHIQWLNIGCRYPDGEGVPLNKTRLSFPGGQADEATLAALPLEAIFWRTTFLENMVAAMPAQPADPSTALRSLLRLAAQRAPLHPLALQLLVCPNQPSKDEAAAGRGGLLQRWFWEDVPYLRAGYYYRHRFPDVIRYEAATDTYWLSPY